MTRRSTADVDQLVKAYRERGDLTRHAFCEKQGISLCTIDYYLRHQKKPAEKRARLARVELRTPERPERFALILSSGRRIECSEGGLAQLIRTAEAI
jgi:transcriptional regulator with XRE-family HTH domain